VRVAESWSGEDQPLDGGLAPLLHPSLKRAALSVCEAALPVALETAQDFYRGPTGLGLEPFLNPWPNGRKGVFACAPVANCRELQLVGRTDLANQPRGGEPLE